MADGLSHSRKCVLSTVTARVSGTHADFPVLFTAANLPAEMFDADGGHAAQDGGGDIRFSADSAGLDLLPCDVVAFVPQASPADGRAEIWVRLPHVRDSQADTIHVWWGAPGAVSQPASIAAHGREAVWAEAELVVLMDAAAPVDRAGNHDLGVGGVPAAIADGPFGPALAFGSGARIYNTTDSALHGVLPTFDTTIEAVARRGATSADKALVSFNGADDWVLYARDSYSSGKEVRVFWRDAGGSPASLWPVSSAGPGWAWVAFTTRAFDDHELFLNGASIAQASVNAAGAGPFAGFCIGDWLDGAQPWGGDIQAVIIWKTARSAEWIATGHAGQSDPAGFIAVGTPEAVGGGAVDLAIFGAAHAQAADGGLLRQDHRLTAADATAEQVAGAVVLGQGHVLRPASGAHAQRADVVSFDGTASLVVGAAWHGQHAGLAGLAQRHRLVAVDGFHGQRAAWAGLAQRHVLLAAGAWQGQRAGAPVLTLASTGAPGGRTDAVGAMPGAISIPSDDRSRSIGATPRTLSITSSR